MREKETVIPKLEGSYLWTVSGKLGLSDHDREGEDLQAIEAICSLGLTVGSMASDLRYWYSLGHWLLLVVAASSVQGDYFSLIIGWGVSVEFIWL